MSDDDPHSPHNAFESDKAGTHARSLSEDRIERLRQGGGVFVEAVRATRMPMVVTDPHLDGNPIVFANEAFLHLSGYAMHEVLGQQPHFMSGADTDEGDAARFRDAVARDRGEVVETVQYRKDGTPLVVAVFVSGFKDAEGRTAHQFLSYLDVTARIAAEDSLALSRRSETASRESEERLADVLEQVPVGVGLFDAEGWLTLKNPILRDLIRERLPSRDEKQGRFWEARDEEGHPLAPEDYPGSRALRGEAATVPTLFRRVADRDERWLKVTAVPMRHHGAVEGGITVVQDVTHDRHVQTELQALARRQAEILESISDAFYAVDAEWRLTYLNRKAEELWARSRQGLVGSRIWEAFPQAVGSEVYRAHLKAAESREVVRIEAVSPILGRWIDVSIYPAANGLSVYFRDITDRKRAEELLRASEERNRLILETARDYAIFTTDEQGRIRSWSPGAEAVFGWTEAEALGQTSAITFTPEDRGRGDHDRELAEAREKGFAPNVRWHLRKDGRRIFIEGWTRPLRDRNAELRGFLKVGQDVTERREWDERQKVLVNELQHRTRNLISVIHSIADRALDYSANLADFRSRFGDRLGALARVQSLLSRLEEWDRVTFDALLDSELAALGDTARVTLEGPKGVALRSSTVQTLALAIHELTTNAIKYGALAQSEGGLRIAWRVGRSAEDPRPWLHVDWQESGVRMPPGGGASARSGAGRELIERALPYQLGATTTLTMTPDGVRCTISLPVSERQGRAARNRR